VNWMRSRSRSCRLAGAGAMMARRMVIAMAAAAAAALGGAVAAGDQAVSAHASPRESLRYTLAPDDESHRLRVELEWRTLGRTSSTLAIAPSWASVENPLAMVGDLRVRGADAIDGTGPAWRIRHEPGATLHVSYEIRAGHRSFDWDRRYLPIVAHRFFHGIGHTFLITPDPDAGFADDYDVTLRWQTPTEWTDAVCSFGVGDEVTARLNAIDLRQSVFLCGSLDVRPVKRDGRMLNVALHDLFRFGVDAFVDRAAEIIDAECALMRDDDFPPFVITVIPVGDPLPPNVSRRAGTGLYRSFALFLPPMSTLDDDVSYLFAHELFHHWNGRVLTREAPEELVYWMSEGFTDYFAFRTLLESFPGKRPSLVKRLNRTIRDYYENPAIDAPNEEIRDGFWRRPETLQRIPYQRGFLLAARWNAIAADRGHDDAMVAWFRDMVERARTDGFRLSNESIRADGVARFGEWFAAEFDRYVIDAKTIELPMDAFSPILRAERRAIHSFELGFDGERSFRAARVHGLVPGSAAAEAGVREGDRLLAWDVVLGDPDREAELVVRRENSQVTLRYLPRGEGRSIPVFSMGR